MGSLESHFQQYISVLSWRSAFYGENV